MLQVSALKSVLCDIWELGRRSLCFYTKTDSKTVPLPPLFKLSDKSTATDSSRCPAQELTRSSADAENPARRDVIPKEEKYQQLVGRRTAVSYAEGVLSY